MSKQFVAGGAGFIGSHMTSRLLADGHEVVAFDNLSAGSREHLAAVIDHAKLELVVADIKEIDDVAAAMDGCERVFLFAANPDIARAATEPDIDFWASTFLANNVLEAARRAGVPRMVFASGSGVYGDAAAERGLPESFGPLLPVSTYGASKIGIEAMICSYCHMFDLQAVTTRFANVVGPRQTHGVTYDFVRKLRQDPSELVIFGDGRQSKSYIHVDDVVDAMLLASDRVDGVYDVFNVGTEDYVTVTEIAEMVVEQMGLSDVAFAYTGGARGWKGDVPVVRFDSSRIRDMGWTNRRTSAEAIAASIAANIEETAGA